MADEQTQTLMAPVSSEAPCGPDLDAQGDADFMNALARADSLLPGSFFKSDLNSGKSEPFGGMAAQDLQAEIKNYETLLERTRDLRLLVNLAKFSALSRKLPEFVDFIAAIAGLLRERWQDVHPQGEGGDYALRIIVLNSLSDRAQAILPLQFSPLLRHPREGVISYRMKMLLDGTPPRDGEEVRDPGVYDRIAKDIELSVLTTQRDRFDRLVKSLDTIADATNEHAAGERVDLDDLRKASADILAFLDDIVRRRDPSASLFGDAESGATSEASAEDDAATAGADGTERPAQAGALASLAQVKAALAGVGVYFAGSEPSNPALLLVRQAEQLVGRNFLEVMQVLLPDHVDTAAIEVGRGETFALPMSRLPVVDETAMTDTDEAAVVVADRRTAMAMLQSVESFFAEREPTSPIPFLCERARRIGTKDFLSVLREILPADTLKKL